MSNGFLATNDNGQILISSDTRNLHLISKLSSPTEIVYSTAEYGGIIVLRYRVSNCSTTPVPFFTMPSTSDYYGVTRITSVNSSTWDIEIIKSGSASSYPEVYIFADPRASTATDTYGLKVFRDDGTPSFDSRLKPLAISGGTSIAHPSNPKSSFSGSLSSQYCGSSGSTYFAPNNYNTYNVSIAPSKPMFSFASLAQAEREATWSSSQQECDGVPDGYGGCIGFQRTYSWSSTYWAFYRGVIKKGSNQIFAGWCTAAFGCRWTYQRDSEFIGIGTGGASGSGGTWPYSNETLNLSSATVIIGDASRYD